MKVVELESLIELTGGGTPSKKKPEYWDGNIPWASVKDLKSSVLTETVDKITQEGLENSSSKLVERGNLIIATRMAVGKTVMTDIDVAINQDLKAVYTSEKINNKYLQYFFASKADYFERTGKGATVKGIKIGDILNLKIPLPSLSEQKVIVAKLDRAQRLIDIDQAMLAKYDELIQSVFLEMFGDPITNSKGWEIKKLGSMIKLIGGGTPSRKNDSYWGGKIKWATVKDLKGDILSSTQESITNDGLENSSSKLIPAGNMIICSRMNVGKVMMNTINVAINQDLKGIFLNENYDKEFIFYFLKTQKKYFEDVSSGATVKGIKIGHINDLKTPVPDSETLIEFKEAISTIRSLKQNYESSLRQSSELFSSLVQGAFG